MGLNVKKSETSVRIGEVRFSYAYVFEPQADDAGKLKYSCQILIPKENKEAIKLVKDAVAAAIEKGKETKTKWKGKVPSNLRNPLRDGDDEKADEDPNYEGMVFLNAKNPRKPGVQVLEDGLRYDASEDEFYSGCWGAVTLDFYPYDNNSNGIGVSLGNLIKLRDDTRLGGGGGESVDDSFDDLD